MVRLGFFNNKSRALNLTSGGGSKDVIAEVKVPGLAVMNNEQRASVKAFMQNVMTPTEQTVDYKATTPELSGDLANRISEKLDVRYAEATNLAPKKAKKQLSPERLAALAKGRAKAAANRAAKKQEG